MDSCYSGLALTRGGVTLSEAQGFARQRLCDAAGKPVQRCVRLRSQDGSESHAPAFLQARPEPRAEQPRPEPAAEEGEVRKPRRRRAPRSFEGGEGEAPAAPETEEA